jgi:hypothetical protein
VGADRAAIPTPSIARRKRMRTRTLSVGLSVVIHVGLIAALAAVVWTTVAPPIPGAGGNGVTGAKINLENSAVATTGPATPSAATTPRGSEGSRPLVGSLEPILSPGALEPLQGLTTASDRPASGASDGAAGSPLGASELLGPLEAPAAGPPASPAIGGGAASVTFGGLGAASVGSVVYVVDCSGPMVTSLPIVMKELKRSVEKLSPTQKFGVVLFRRIGEDGSGAEAFAQILVHPSPSAKALLDQWISGIEPSGRSSPLAGLELALSLKPDAIFLLSRSIQRSGGNVWELGLDATMARLEQLNPVRSALVGGRRGVLIQTIQFLDEDPTGIMQAIGQRHGGGNGYRVVKRQQDLQTEPHASRGGPLDAAAVDR